jgi:hypothetical protein
MQVDGIDVEHQYLPWRMIFSDLASPAEAGFAKAGNRNLLFGTIRYRPK